MWQDQGQDDLVQRDQCKGVRVRAKAAGARFQGLPSQRYRAAAPRPQEEQLCSETVPPYQLNPCQTRPPAWHRCLLQCGRSAALMVYCVSSGSDDVLCEWL